MAVVEELLDDLQVGSKPVLVVFNKIDLLGSDTVIDSGMLGVSAGTGWGVEKLLHRIDEMM
jgi:50S ribosomal subunit-associated GTPase HflX